MFVCSTRNHPLLTSSCALCVLCVLSVLCVLCVLCVLYVLCVLCVRLEMGVLCDFNKNLCGPSP